MNKKCTKCQKDLSLEQFRSDARYAGGLTAWCRDCINEQSRKRYRRDPESHREHTREWWRQKHVFQLKPILLPVEECAYLAGFMDGEGTITANNRKIFNHEKLAVHYRIMLPNTNLDILEYLHDKWGGRISRFGTPRSPKHKQVYYLYWGGDKVIPVLHAILPYLRIKKQQGELVLELSKLSYTYANKGERADGGGQGRYVPPEYIPRRQEIVTEIAKLNHRGKEVVSP